MAYPKRLREAAFKIYAGGKSYEDTAAIMRKKFNDDCPTIRRQTIEKWANDQNENWHGRLDAIKKEVMAATDQDIISDRLIVLSQARTLRESLFNQLKGKRAKSLEGGVNSLIGLQKMILELTGEHPKYKRNMNAETIVMMIFQVFSEDPKIAEALKSRQDYLLQQINQRLIEAQY